MEDRDLKDVPSKYKLTLCEQASVNVMERFFLYQQINIADDEARNFDA